MRSPPEAELEDVADLLARELCARVEPRHLTPQDKPVRFKPVDLSQSDFRFKPVAVEIQSHIYAMSTEAQLDDEINPVRLRALLASEQCDHVEPRHLTPEH